jgi:hypothetical protein
MQLMLNQFQCGILMFVWLILLLHKLHAVHMEKAKLVLGLLKQRGKGKINVVTQNNLGP